MITSDSWIYSRILRDMSDGVLVLDSKGIILHVNEIGCNLLGLEHNPTGERYATLWGDNSCNDAFHQLVLDAVYDKVNSQTGTVYWNRGGEKRLFKLTASFLRDESGDEKAGVVVLLRDVTEEDRLNRQQRESSIIFAGIMLFICASLFFWSASCFYQWNLPLSTFSWSNEILSLAMFAVVFKTKSFSFGDLGLKLTNVKSTILPDIFIALGGVGLLIVGKVILLQVAPGFFPAGAPFWDWSIVSTARLANWLYPFTVVLQEFLSRSVLHGCLQRIFTGKHGATLALVVSSVVFGVTHIAFGFHAMVGAVILLGFFGILYNKQGHIWGLCIIHYVLGKCAEFLHYTM